MSQELIISIVVLFISVVMLFAQIKLFSIDQTLRDILERVIRRKGKGKLLPKSKKSA